MCCHQYSTFIWIHKGIAQLLVTCSFFFLQISGTLITLAIDGNEIHIGLTVVDSE